MDGYGLMWYPHGNRELTQYALRITQELRDVSIFSPRPCCAAITFHVSRFTFRPALRYPPIWPGALFACVAGTRSHSCGYACAVGPLVSDIPQPREQPDAGRL